ncbi:MAG: hypothetical protein KF696_01620 [Planctomycetes bacterium]|nr:hypothetical protein [Planctomycetota bacterium]MCW8134360.1 hypothetical protein [Planctomycetota bacterium]
MRLRLSIAVWLTLAVLISSHGQDRPNKDSAGVVEGWQELKEGPAPAASDLEDAQRRVAALSADDIAAIDCLRFLLRPEWTRELFPHIELPRRVQLLSLHGQGPLSTEEVHRLWALLQAGYPADEHLLAALDRLAKTPADPVDGWLDQPLALMLACRAALHRQAGKRKELEDAIRDTWKALEPLLKQVGEKQFQYRPRTTCTLSTVLIWRIATEYKLKVPRDFIDYDIEQAFKALKSRTGNEATEPREAGPLGLIAAISLAADAQPRCEAARTILRDEKELLRDKLRYTARLCERNGLRSSLLSLIQSVSPDLTPTGMTAEQWSTWKSRHVRYLPASNGAVLALRSHDLRPRSNRWRYTEFNTTVHDSGDMDFRLKTRDQERVSSTALTLIGLSGGLLPPPPGRRHKPLIRWTPEELDGLMRARTTIAAAEHNRLTRELKQWVPEAIGTGCEQLVSSQRADGGVYPDPMKFRNEMLTGGKPRDFQLSYSALAGLALLHGGYDRDGPVIRGIVKYIEAGATELGERQVYQAACVLLFLQRYYLPEQKQALAATAPQAVREARANVWQSIPARHQTLINDLARTIEDSRIAHGMAWAYSPQTAAEWRKHHTARKEPVPWSQGDNSNAQYAMLGLWCSSLLGRTTKAEYFESEVQRLAQECLPLKGASPVPLKPPTPQSESSMRPGVTLAAEDTAPVVGWAYQAGTFAHRDKSATPAMTAGMLGTLKIAISELRVQAALTPQLERTGERLAAGALGFLSECIADDVEGDEHSFSGWDRYLYFWGPTYSLYSVERACMLAGVRVLYGNEDWYRSGALYLKRNLTSQGGWDVSVLATAWVVLFLKRAIPAQPLPPPESADPVTGPKDGAARPGD